MLAGNMHFKLLQFNKLHETIDQFSDLLQKTLNESNDLIRMEAFESGSGNNVYIAMTFSKSKSEPCELIAFSAARLNQLQEQLDATLTLAYAQNKEVVALNVVPYSKSPRAIGFLVLQKVKEPLNADQTEKRQAATGKQNSKAHARANPGTKN